LEVIQAHLNAIRNSFSEFFLLSIIIVQCCAKGSSNLFWQHVYL